MTVSQLALDFEENYMLRRLKPTTIRGYMRNIEAYICPFLGSNDISSIGYSQIDFLVKKSSLFGLSNTSIIYILSTLSKMYSYAVKRGYTSFNPLLAYDYPRKNSFQYNTLDERQIDKLIRASHDSDIYPAILLASHYGLRRGECSALTIKDLTGNVLRICKTASRIKGENVVTTPKNDRVRYIKLAHHDVDALLQYDFSRQINADGKLIRKLDGTAVSPNSINKQFKKLLRKLKLPDVRFHDLRHSYATIMMKNGVNPKIVSSVLGHSSVDITLDLYSHCYIDMQDACLEVFKKT